MVVTEAELIQVAEKLPTAPRLLVELGELLNDRNVEADDVVNLLRQDPALVARLIRISNSAAYSPSEPVGSLERALAHVGFAEVHRLVGAVAAEQLADLKFSAYPVDGSTLRLHALYVAVLMEELAKFAGERPRSCYTIGLLRTIGLMALERLPRPESGVPPFAASGETVLGLWEKRRWGITSAEAGEQILNHWKFPRESVAAIRYHYEPGQRHNPLIYLLVIAVAAAAERRHGLPGEDGYWMVNTDTLVRAGLTQKTLSAACERAQEKFDHLHIAIG